AVAATLRSRHSTTANQIADRRPAIRPGHSTAVWPGHSTAVWPGHSTAVWPTVRSTIWPALRSTVWTTVQPAVWRSGHRSRLEYLWPGTGPVCCNCPRAIDVATRVESVPGVGSSEL